MGGVGDEASLGTGGVVETGEHVVEGAGEPADLIIAAGFGEAPVQIGGGDRRGFGADAFHWAQSTAHDQPGDRGNSNEDKLKREKQVALQVDGEDDEQTRSAAG